MNSRSTYCCIEWRIDLFLHNPYILSGSGSFSLKLLCTPSAASRMVCGGHFCLLRGQAATFYIRNALLHWWRVIKSTARVKHSFCTHPSTPSTRLDMLQLPFLKSSVYDSAVNRTPSASFSGLLCSAHSNTYSANAKIFT